MGTRKNKQKKQAIWKMKGCATKKKRPLIFCTVCDINCRCKPGCSCGHKCPGTCHLKPNIMKRRKTGVGFRRGVAMSSAMSKAMSSAMSGGGGGGGCSSCSAMPFFKGGCATCMPGQHGGSVSLVGAPWTGGNIGSWPGVAGTAGVSNHFPLNNYNGGDPSYLLGQERSGNLGPSLFYGGMKGRKNSRNKRIKTRKGRGRFRGGGLIPQGIQNIGNNMRFGLQSAGNALQGFPAPVNPNPTAGQFLSPK